MKQGGGEVFVLGVCVFNMQNKFDLLNRCMLVDIVHDFCKVSYRSTQRTNFEIVSYFTALGLKWLPNNFKPDDYLNLLNGFILNFPARNTENIMAATLHQFASRIKLCYTEVLVLCIVWKRIFCAFLYLS